MKNRFVVQIHFVSFDEIVQLGKGHRFLKDACKWIIIVNGSSFHWWYPKVLLTSTTSISVYFLSPPTFPTQTQSLLPGFIYVMSLLSLFFFFLFFFLISHFCCYSSSSILGLPRVSLNWIRMLYLLTSPCSISSFLWGLRGKLRAALIKLRLFICFEVTHLVIATREEAAEGKECDRVTGQKQNQMVLTEQ